MTTLQEWISNQVVADEMLWKGAFGEQVSFIRDSLTPIVCWGLHYSLNEQAATVISTHTSKSIRLPVVQIARPDMDLRLIVRENFYNWKLSVISSVPIEVNFDGLFQTTPPVEPDYTGNPLASVYFEGFPENLVFGYYAPSDKKTWSAEIFGDHRLWTTVFLILKSLGVVKPMEWNTRERHKAELEKHKAELAVKSG
jgi:hypothetical protein